MFDYIFKVQISLFKKNNNKNSNIYSKLIKFERYIKPFFLTQL